MTQVEKKIPKFNIVLHIYLYIPYIHENFKFVLLWSKRPDVGCQIMARKGRTGNPKTISPTRSAGDSKNLSKIYNVCSGMCRNKQGMERQNYM